MAFELFAEDSPIPGLIFGGCLIVGGIFMLLAQKKARQQLTVSEVSASDRRHLLRRISRRTQVAGLILIIGVMIPLGDAVISWQNAPGTFAVYWLIVIGLALWVAILGLGDMAATQVHSTVQLNEIHRKQLELESVARKLKRSENAEGTEPHS